MTSYDFSALSVLIAEDAAHMASVTTGILRAAGIRDMRVAANGAEAWTQLAQRPVDLAIVDWLMPVMDGLAFLKRLRTDTESPQPRLPVIMMTGHTELWRIRMMRDAGTTEVLAKPIAAQTLIDRVIHVLTKPRPFVETDLYFGPDRRRHRDGLPPPTGDRRLGEEPAAPGTVDEDDTVSLSQAEINALLNP